jgi:hypothetical protein
MRICGDSGGPGRADVRRRTPALSRGQFVVMLVSLGGFTLAGCGPDGPGSFLVDPGHYAAYHCNDLATRWKALIARENELRGLIEKAREGGGGGAVIGSLAYRSDYDSVLAEEKQVQRAAADKNCGFTPDYQSDHTIR